MLESISYLICSAFIMLMTSIILGIIVLEQKEIKITLEKVIIVLVGTIAYSIAIDSLTGTTKTLLLGLINTIVYAKILKISYSDAIFLTFMYIVLTIIPDTIFLLFIMNILKIDPVICYTQFTSSLIATISVSIMLLLIVFIFRKLLRRLIKIKIDNSKLIIIYTILTLGCVVIVFYKSTAQVSISKNLVEGIIIMVVFVIILYSLMKQKLENKKIAEKYDKLLEFIKKYEVIIEEQRETKHETKNQLITVKSKVLNKEKGEDIIEYVDSILNDHKAYKEDKYGKFQYLPANGIKGLFYYKSIEAEEKGINLSINIGKRVETSIMSKLKTEDFKQLGRLIGVYIDNAIEASSISKEKKLGIEIYVHEEDVVLIIMNTYAGVIDKDTVGKVRYSTKGNNRGYGLMLVNRILSSSTRFIAERTITDELYIQKLIIKKSI